jgi:hypothetical protein
MSLNAIKVENLKPKAADYRVADGGGLYVLVRPNGSKLWRYDYRLGTTRRTFSIGEYHGEGDGRRRFTLKQARDEHEAAQKAVKAGPDALEPVSYLSVDVTSSIDIDASELEALRRYR